MYIIPLAKYVMELATGEVRAETPETEMARRGRVGGLKGGKARAEALTPKFTIWHRNLR